MVALSLNALVRMISHLRPTLPPFVSCYTLDSLPARLCTCLLLALVSPIFYTLYFQFFCHLCFASFFSRLAGGKNFGFQTLEVLILGPQTNQYFCDAWEAREGVSTQNGRVCRRHGSFCIVCGTTTTINHLQPLLAQTSTAT